MALLARVLDPIERLAWTRRLLQHSAHQGSAHPRPIAVLLFLVELVALLVSQSVPGDVTRREGQDPAAASAQEPVHSSPVSQDKSPPPAPTVSSPPSTSSRTDERDSAPATGVSAPAPAPGHPHPRTGTDWTMWAQYMFEVYARPAVADEQNAESHHTSTALAPAPLLLPSEPLDRLRTTLARPALDSDTRSELVSACAASALDYLIRERYLHQESESPVDTTSTLNMLVSEGRTSSFPAPLPASTVSAIALSLAHTRTAGPSVCTEESRRILTTLLGHYVSPAAFATVHERDEPFKYATSRSDEDLIRGCFPSPPPESADIDLISHFPEDDDEDAETDKRSIAAGIREAQASIVRKDDKLRWLLGDNFQPGAPRATAKSKPAAHLRAREDSYGSFASTSTAASAEAISLGKRHQRLASTASSCAPLLGGSSPSRPSFSPHRASFLHRRVVSTSSSDRSHALYPAEKGRSAPAVLDIPWTHQGRPFTDLAVERPQPSGGPSAPTAAPAAGPCPEPTSHDFAFHAHRSADDLSSPLHCNNLSAEQRRKLVRRSKKLEGFFGAPFQESAAARVLVDGRAEAAAGHHPGELVGEAVSPTDGSFPARHAASSDVSSEQGSTGRGAAHAKDPSYHTALAPPVPPVTSGAPSDIAQARAIATTTPSTFAQRDARRPSTLSLSSSSQSSTWTTDRYHPSTTPASLAFTAPRSPRSPPSRPTLHRSSSAPSSGRRSGSFSSLADPQHTYSSERIAAERAREVREERRRKLDKVSRVLGERVPLALVVPREGEAIPRTTPEGRDKARRGPEGLSAAGPVPSSSNGHGGGGGGGGGYGGLRDRLKRRGVPTAAVAPEPIAGGGDAGWTYVEPQWAGCGGYAEGDADELRKGRQGVDALHRARKLENLFGDLPPSALFVTPASPGPLSAGLCRPSRPSFLETRQRRSYSDLSDLSGHLHSHISLCHSPNSRLSGCSVQHASVDPDGAGSSPLHRETTRSTVDSYRQSIASLRYVVERDPKAYDEVVRAYAGEMDGSGRIDADAAPPGAEQAENDDEDEDEGGPGWGAPGMRRTQSASSQRAVRQAQKLSNFFGTTHGEVWRLFLNDIREAILDDESLDPDERAEVLASLERLHQSAPTRS